MPIFLAIKAFFTVAGFKKSMSGLLKQPLFYVAIALLAIGGGTYGYLKYSTNQAVNKAVAGANSQATIKTYQTKDQAEAQLAPIQQQEQQKAIQTQKDYDHVRTVIVTSQAPQRNAQVPSLVIDTLNDLDRLSQARDANPVPVAPVHSR